ncbi:hypothetical protein RFI_16411, partial [Reticulomyxa filosa]
MEEYDNGAKGKEDCRTRCCRDVLLWTNGILSIIALVLIVVDVYVYETGKLKYIGDVTVVLFVVVLALSIIVLLVSLIGCLGAKTKSLYLLGVYIIGLIVALAIECAIVAMCFDPNYLKSTLRQRWNSLSTEKQSEVEKNLSCCGFDGENNYKSGSSSGTSNGTATTSGSCTGCYQAMANDLRGLESALGAITICLIAYEIVIFVFTVCLFCQRKKSDRQST